VPENYWPDKMSYNIHALVALVKPVCHFSSIRYEAGWPPNPLSSVQATDSSFLPLGEVCEDSRRVFMEMEEGFALAIKHSSGFLLQPGDGPEFQE
jgi:hypothetical protein